MRISKTKVLDFLMRCQIERGGYTGPEKLLILLMSGIVNILNGKKASKWGGMSPVSIENIVLFVPA